MVRAGAVIYPKPRNAIDSRLPQWQGGKSPTKWQPHGDNPCACRNGTELCDVGQTCLWMSVGCSIGCKECDGGQGGHGGTNPNGKDRCGSGMQSTNNDPLHRTFNRACTGSCVGTADDYTRFNPWRARAYLLAPWSKCADIGLARVCNCQGVSTDVELWT